VQIVFSDPPLGRRTGWIQLKYVTLSAAAPPPPPPAPPVPAGQPSAQGTVPPQRPPRPSVRAFGTFGFDKMSADDSFQAITGSDTTYGFGGGVQGINLWKGLFAEVNVEYSTVDGERAFVFNDEVFPLGIPMKIKTRPIDVVAGWRAGAGGRHPYAAYGGGGVTFMSYKETDDFAAPDEEVDEQKTGFVALFGVEVTVWRWIHLRGEGRYRRVTGILGNGGVSAAFDEDYLGGFGGGVKVVVGR
jgi:opacity protein-like surface antigen